MTTKVILNCYFCKKDFKKYIGHFNVCKEANQKLFFCSRRCYGFHITSIKTFKVSCSQCGIEMIRRKSSFKGKNVFCSQSCGATYNNTHKTHGTRRSKLEVFLEEKLKELYPNLHIVFNGKETINSELDIYIPSLKLAFELNGIFHYEPIYGADKLKSIQNNDTRKFQACLEKGIELCIVDTSKLKYFKISNVQKYLDIISSIINCKLNQI